ncbi:MAG: AbrB/MazE/SpoVT family DNA-binding domain-containing protein [Methyloglobulus sp.]|nr:AbrB/MazE/SpoVT family DNA-binding domain-containing protein [Methyloglobulus sp.]
MSVATIKLSSKGQIVIPKEIRDELHWEAGMQLSLVATGSGVSLKAISAKTGRNLGDLIGLLKHDGDSIAIEALCKPVDVRVDWEKSEQRNK